MFDKLLIANRGEIAARIIATARRMGIGTVCVHSAADSGAAYLALADEAICIGPAPSAASYLNGEAIVLAARLTGAGAIHPGYGFLSENAAFADSVAEAGLVFVGPDASSIRTMGDKVAAKREMLAAGVPCVPGSDGALPDDPDDVERIARDIGYPVILKAAAGGGGRGMRVVHDRRDLGAALSATREEARLHFANPDIYLEKFLERPRHVEIQVVGDGRGGALWLGDRDCSLQRRHQKVVEEAPAPGIDRSAVDDLGRRCVEACRRMRYSGAGTFEFLFEDGRFAFIEMNTRIQVEHPVTEMVTGLDIVALQLRVARGEDLPLVQDDVSVAGHAVEARINAEDAFSFVPSPGRIERIVLPTGPGVRVDTHVTDGTPVPPYYDSLVAKLVVHGATREEAFSRMRAALDDFRVDGISTNLALHRAIFTEPRFLAGGVDIHHLERMLAEGAIG